MNNFSNNVSGQNSENTVEELLEQLSIGEEIPSSMKKDFDKIHRAMEARSKYLMKRNRARKRQYEKISRKALSEKRTFKPEALPGAELVGNMVDYALTCKRVPETLSSLLDRHNRLAEKLEDSAELAESSAKVLLEKISSEKFAMKVITNGTLTLMRWYNQKPIFIVAVLDVVQLILNTMIDFITMSASAVIEAAQRLLDAVSPSTPAQLPEGDDRFRPEAMNLESPDNIVAIVSSMVSLLGTAMLGKRVIASPDLMKSVKTYGEIGRATTGIKQLYENSTNLVSWVIEGLQALVTNFRAQSLVTKDKICIDLGIDDTYMEYVEDLIDPCKLEEYMMTHEFRSKLQKARYKLLQFTAKKYKGSDPILRTYITARIISLSKILNDNMQKFVGKGGEARMVPFCIQFFGEPGSGKSTVMNPVVKALLTEGGSGRVLENTHVSSMTGVTKYWDGFRGEAGLTIDDAFMTRGAAPNESEHTRFISLISCVSMTIPKADLTSKGLTADSIKLVVCSSNCEQPKASEINNSDAMLRRRHMVFLTIRNDGSDGRIDPKNDFSRFQLRDSITRANIGNSLTFCEMLRLCSKRFKSHLTEQEALVNMEDIPSNFFDEDIDVPTSPIPLDTKIYDSIHPFEEEVEHQRNKRKFKLNKFQPEGAEDWNFRQPEPNFFVEDHRETCLLVEPYSGKKIKHSIRLLDPRPNQDFEATYYFTPFVCCSPVRLYYDKYRTWKYCNATRMFNNGLDLTVADFDYNDLTPKHMRTFEEALDAGMMLPEETTVWKYFNPCEPEEYMAWEAIRAQERVYRQCGINRYNNCVSKHYKRLGFYDDLDSDFDLVGWTSSYDHSGKILEDQLNLDLDFTVRYGNPFQPEGIFDFFTPKTVNRAILIAEALTVVGTLYAGIKLFKAVKNLVQSAHLVIPSLDYDTNSLQAFIDSAPEQYRGALAKTVSEIAVTVQKEQALIMEALPAYDPSARTTKHVRMTPQGIVYDGSAKGKTAMAMKVQAIFADHGIKTNTSAEMVRAMCPEGIDENFSVKRLALSKNSMSFHRGPSEVVVLRGTALKDRFVLVPNHFARMFKEDEEIRVKHNGVSTYFRFKNSFLHMPGDMTKTHSDWAILRLPLVFNQFKNIMHTLLRERDIPLLDNSSPILFLRGFNADNAYAQLDTETSIEDVDDDQKIFERKIARAILYSVMTAPGDCGSMILVSSNSIDGIMAGIHVAGNKGTGMAQLITYEMIDMFMKDLDEDKFPSEPKTRLQPFILTQDPMQVEGSKKIQNDENLPAWGLVPNAFASVPATTSKMKLSEITKINLHEGNEFFESNRASPTFSLEDPRVDDEIRQAGVKPISLALNKYAEAPHTFPTQALELAYVTILTALSSIVPRNVTKRLLTFSETLNGIPGFMIPIDVRTSMGFPYVKLSRGTKGKSALIKDINDAYNTGKEPFYEINDDPDGPTFQGELLSTYFYNRYEETEKIIRSGAIPSYFAYENMKDELVSSKKIKNAKVRTFECLPLEISLLTRRYFGVFMGAMQQNCVTAPISVGINPTSLDWTLLFQRLTKFGEESLIAGDYTNWDGKLMADVFLKAVDAVNIWYDDGEENKNARIALVLSFIHTDVLVLNTLVRKRSGMPSGAPVTAPLNSLCNWFYILTAIIDMLEQKHFVQETGQQITPTFLLENIEDAYYGDDHVVALSSILRKFINFQDFVTYFGNIGILYTDSQKREEVNFQFENIYEITYLKRRFLRDKEMPKLIRAPLALGSITDMIVWTKKSPSTSDSEVYRSRVKDFEDSLAQHEQETYDLYIKIYNRAIDTVLQSKPQLAKNYPKIYTPYSFHTQNFLKERGALE